MAKSYKHTDNNDKQESHNERKNMDSVLFAWQLC